jgi:hypothetical protein
MSPRWPDTWVHRVEGDIGNAQYWYDRTGEDMPKNKLEDELTRLYEMADKTSM